MPGVKSKAPRRPTNTGNKVAAGGGLRSAVATGVSALLGGGSKKATTHSRRRKGAAYWQNKALAEKYRKKYMRLRFGGV